MKPIKTIFIGTSEEGTDILTQLEQNKQFDIIAVVTQPDRPVGRKHEMTPSPIKKHALELGKTVLAPQNGNDLIEITRQYDFELAVVIAYGKFLPQAFLDHPKYKCINVHYSLLPQLRGAIPAQAAILNGLEKTGVTVQVMEEKMDTGPILAQTEIEIESRETTPSLKKKLVPTGTKLLMNTLPAWIAGKIEPKKQDHSKATYCYITNMSKEAAQIQWELMHPKHIDRMIRAFLPWPVAWTVLPDGKRLKIFEGELGRITTDQKPGNIVVKDSEIHIPTKDKGVTIRVKELQIEGKRKMTAQEFVTGWKT